MKKLPILAVLVLAVVVVISFMPPANSIVGRWKITYKSGNVAYIQFHNNGTFKAELVQEHLTVGGKYKLTGNTYSISDTSCNAAYWGTYKLTFHGADSIWSDVIEDSCAPRRSAADKVFLVRQK